MTLILTQLSKRQIYLFPKIFLSIHHFWFSLRAQRLTFSCLQTRCLYRIKRHLPNHFGKSTREKLILVAFWLVLQSSVFSFIPQITRCLQYTDLLKVTVVLNLNEISRTNLFFFEVASPYPFLQSLGLVIDLGAKITWEVP